MKFSFKYSPLATDHVMAHLEIYGFVSLIHLVGYVSSNKVKFLTSLI